MKQIIDNIQDKLKEVKDLAYIDENWGQLDEYGTRPPVKYPCALIDFSNINFSNIGQDKRKMPIQRQQGEAQLSIIIANMKLTNTGGKAPVTQRDQARSIWGVLDKVHACLHGYKPAPYAGALIRNRLERVQRDDGVQIYVIYYTAGLHNV